jgi:hypothetical protein
VRCVSARLSPVLCKRLVTRNKVDDLRVTERQHLVSLSPSVRDSYDRPIFMFFDRASRYMRLIDTT